MVLNNNLNNGNLTLDYTDGALWYNVQVGADTVRKKCSGIDADRISVVASYASASGTSVVLKGTYTADEDMTVLASYFLDSGGNKEPVTNGTVIFQSGKISASDTYCYGLSIISLKAGEYIQLYSRQNGAGRIIRLD